jgi:hypothetical protein
MQLSGGIMEKIDEKTLTFINDFISNNELKKIEITKYSHSSNFLNNEVGLQYIGNFLKSIDINLYLLFLKMQQGKINFKKEYDISDSINITKTNMQGNKIDSNIYVPYIKNGANMLATVHELGHGLKNFNAVGETRITHSDSIFDETISIFLAKLCELRYINDFGYENQVIGFEILNINNAVKCLITLSETLKKYMSMLEKIETAKPQSKTATEKYTILDYEIGKIINELYTEISYPIGIALLDVYLGFSQKEKEEYRKLITKFIISQKMFDFNLILSNFGIEFNGIKYYEHFKHYIEEFKNTQSKHLVKEGATI